MSKLPEIHCADCEGDLVTKWSRMTDGVICVELCHKCIDAIREESRQEGIKEGETHHE